MSMRKLLPPKEWQEIITKYLEELKASGLTSETIETRRRKISHLARLLDIPPLEVTSDDLIHIFAKQEWNNETLRGYATTARSFWNYLEDKELTHDIAVEIPHVKVPHGIPHPIPEDALIQAYKTAGKQELFMLRLGAECGLRRNEIAQVHSHDVIDDYIGKSLIIHGKGGKERIVPIADDLATDITNAGGYMFPGRWTGHVEASYIGKHVSKALNHKYSCHSLRHRFATRTYEQTNDLFLVSKLLGHESVVTTQIYVAMPQQRLRSAVEAVRLHV